MYEFKISRVLIFVLALVLVVIQTQDYYPTGQPIGLAHYVNYDDYEIQETEKSHDPKVVMKPNLKTWNEEVMYIPELILEDPNPRKGTSPLPLNQGPCGGTERGSVYYSAFPGRSNLIRWKIIHPISEGNCTIKLSNGLDEAHESSFQPLNPVYDFAFQNQEGSMEYYSGEQGNYNRQFYKRGKFSCGQVEAGTFESITVKFPNLT